MRFNKQKLAALMMSAVMAASTMSTVVFAEDTTAVAEETVQDTTPAAAALDTASCEIDDNGVAHWRYVGETEEHTDQAQKKIVDATCTAAKRYEYTYSIGGYTFTPNIVEEGTPLGHDFGAATETVEYPNGCDEAGNKVSSKTCKRCNYVETTSTSIPAKGHSYTVTTEYKNLKNVELKDGEPTLVETDKVGTYDEIVTKVCRVCGHKEGPTTTSKTLNPTTPVYASAKVIDVDNVVDTIKDKDPSTLESTDIVLVDCSKDGSYVVGYFDASDNKLSERTVSVKAGHSTYVDEPVAATAADAKLLQKYQDEKGNWIATSKSCATPAKYYEVVKCRSTTCSCADHIVSKTLKEAEPVGDHTIKAASKTAVSTLTASESGTTKKYVTQAAYDTFMAFAKGKDSGVKVETTVTCENEGTATITYLCEECGKEITGKDKVVTVNVQALNHASTTTKTENEVAATCNAAGSYDAVTYCDYCNKVMKTEKVKLPQLQHVYDSKVASTYGVKLNGTVVVDADGAIKKGDKFTSILGWPDKVGNEFSITAKQSLTCKLCGETKENGGKVGIVVVDVKKQSGNGDPGSITFNASYTAQVDGKDTTITTGDVSYPYFSNMVAYLERNPEKDPLNGLHLDKDGKFRYYQNNEFQKDYDGIVRYDGSDFFVANGELCDKANGLTRNDKDGKWYFLSNGMVQRGYTGITVYDHEFFYLINGELDTRVNGLVPYQGGTFLFAAGMLQQNANGLWMDTDKTWYFLARGQVQSDFTGTTVYDGQTFELVNGKLV